MIKHFFNFVRREIIRQTLRRLKRDWKLVYETYTPTPNNTSIISEKKKAA